MSRPRCHPGHLGTLLALLLAACASNTDPEAPRPAPPASAWPADAHAAAAVAASPSHAAAIGWREYITDPALRQLVALALDNNRDLRGALARVAEARALHGVQSADRLPTVALGAAAARSRTPADLNLSQRPLLGTEHQVNLGLASWELDLWGRVRDLQAAALHNVLASEDMRRAVQLALVAQVANSWLVWRELDERLALAREAVASRETSTRIFTRREALGAISRLSLTQVQTLLLQAQALAAQLELDRARQAHALAQLVGAELPPQPPARPLDDTPAFASLPAGLPSDLLSARPDIVAAEHRLQAAQAQVAAARAAFFPRIALTGKLGTASAELGGLFDVGSASWVFSPSISLPLFDGGRRQAGLDGASARREAALADYDKTVQTAFRDVADALAARHWLAEQWAIQRAGVAALAERARLATLRYDHGASPYLEVLDAQRDLLAAQQQAVQARRALLSSQVSLYAALGGGSLTAPPPADPRTAPALPAASAASPAGPTATKDLP